MSAATGVFVIPAVPYLQALGLTRDGLMQAMGISFTTATLALLPGLVGMAAGERLRHVLSPLVFKRCFMGSLFLPGLQMIARTRM